VIRELVQSGADPNARMDRTNHRRTALHLAVVKKQPASLTALIDLGVDLNLEDAVGLTPLDQAALDGEDEMARLLITAGAAITLPAAIALDRPDQIDRLVRADPEILSTTDTRRWAPLLVHASRRAPGPVLDRLLRALERHRSGLTIVNMEAGEETAVDGAPGYTALHEAAFHGNVDAIRVLLEHGANPRARDGKYCGTPAGWARFAGHAAAADLILEADVDIFDAINADRGDLVARVLDRDPGALDRPFKAYASCEPREGQWWPEPACTPVQWASSQNKPAAARVLVERGAATRTPDDLERAERMVSFLQSACWDHHTHGKGDHRMHDRAAQRILAQHPDIARDSLYTAIVCGEIDEVRRILTARPGAAREAGGSRGWTPILYLAYTRFTHPPTHANAVAIARLLLDAGANPNDFYMAGDARYSVLTGVAGEGEQDSPRQPYAPELFELLLERGADPFDIQVLYDTHFSGDVFWWLELVYKHTIDTPRGAAWKDPDWPMLDMGGYGCGARFLLSIAMGRRDLPLAEWLLARGANPNAAPARARHYPKRSLYEEAVREGFPEMADLLAGYGATRTTPVFDAEEEFIQACFRLDRETARAHIAAHPESLRSTKAIFAAARRDRADVVALLLEAGVPIEIEDRHKARPLHHAAANNALSVARLLVDRGAEIDPRETQWGATPIGWAAHGDKTEMIEFLSRYSRVIWTLCFRGYVDRVREILSEQPDLAKQLDNDGCTPLWWLPDDEQKAMAIVALLLAAGADPAVKTRDGRTAADWARRRGMQEVAARLETAAATSRRP
jgi:ankyrin repeat protein